jgi:hypothetical protein
MAIERIDHLAVDGEDKGIEQAVRHRSPLVHSTLRSEER